MPTVGTDARRMNMLPTVHERSTRISQPSSPHACVCAYTETSLKAIKRWGETKASIPALRMLKIVSDRAH